MDRVSTSLPKSVSTSSRKLLDADTVVMIQDQVDRQHIVGRSNQSGTPIIGKQRPRRTLAATNVNAICFSMT